MEEVYRVSAIPDVGYLVDSDYGIVAAKKAMKLLGNEDEEDVVCVHHRIVELPFIAELCEAFYREIWNQ